MTVEVIELSQYGQEDRYNDQIPGKPHRGCPLEVVTADDAPALGAFQLIDLPTTGYTADKHAVGENCIIFCGPFSGVTCLHLCRFATFAASIATLLIGLGTSASGAFATPVPDTRVYNRHGKKD